jgi:proline dehydrogenase
MLRRTLIYLSQAEWARSLVSKSKFAWKTASRFVAGDDLENAIKAIQLLNSDGVRATVDHLGENTESFELAKMAASDIVEIFSRIDQTGIKANVSVKLTQIGLTLDPELCFEHILQIVDTAKQQDNFVRIDMEDSDRLPKTLEIFHKLLDLGYTNVGIVIQSYLYRSEQDIISAMKDGGRVRLCKGAYREPPDIAFPKKTDVDGNYDKLVDVMLAESKKITDKQIDNRDYYPPYVAIATHDVKRIEYAKEAIKRSGISKDDVEFQMLYGIRRDLQTQLVNEGYSLRIYVPYGIEWYPYFMRRLAERPANLWFFISNFFRG